MDLTSRDGDWFLEELSSISGNVNHFLNTLERNTSVSDTVVHGLASDEFLPAAGIAQWLEHRTRD